MENKKESKNLQTCCIKQLRKTHLTKKNVKLKKRAPIDISISKEVARPTMAEITTKK